jgi:hypothetical protein
VSDIQVAIPWLDREVRLDSEDIRHQIDWFRAQGELKNAVNAADIIDKRYVVALPGRE